MNAIEFLINEHEKVRQILADISDKSHRAATKKQLFDNLCQHLLRHEKMEQKLWYPHFENDEKVKDIVKHLKEEEVKAEKAMSKLEKNSEPENWDADFFKFKQDVEHHASEEETKLFPQVAILLNEVELETIGQEFREFKEKFSSYLK